MLCTCRRIDGFGSVDSPEDTRDETPVDWTSLEAAAGLGHCSFCSIVRNVVLVGTPPESVIRTVNIRLLSGIYLAVSVGYLPPGSSVGVFDEFFPIATQPTPWDFVPVEVPTEHEPPSLTTAARSISEWLKDCDHNHPCFGEITKMTPLPSRLIDVGGPSQHPRLETTASRTGRYAALSHRWGPMSLRIKRLTTTRANIDAHYSGLSLIDMPATFRDAIYITRSLGLQYLWIDSLCIIQDSEIDWAQESGRMADVYRNAYVVLAADAASNSDAGLIVGPAYHTGPKLRRFLMFDNQFFQHEIRVRKNWPKPGMSGAEDRDDAPRSCYASETTSQLDGRAWVLQERLLSSRTVHFANIELMWECNSRHECSCGNAVGGYSARNLYVGQVFRAFVGNIYHQVHDPNLAVAVWHSIVADFTGRHLTKYSDRLPALSGLAKMMPFPAEEYLAGLWKESIHRDLIWINPLGHATWQADTGDRDAKFTTIDLSFSRQIPDHAPSWSWASVTTPVSFTLDSLRDLNIEWKVKYVRCVPTTANPFGPVDPESMLDIEGYLIAGSLIERPAPSSAVSAVTGHTSKSMEVWFNREDEQYEGRNKTWFDVGLSGREWYRSSGSFYVLIIGCSAYDTPLALILRRDEYLWSKRAMARIGVVRLDNRKNCQWRVGGRQETVRIL